MKFKELRTSMDIVKVIDIETMTHAPLDNKNVMTDWIDEQLFDEGCVCHPHNSKKMLGYIGCVPVELQYNDNTMYVKCIHRINNNTNTIVLGKFSEIFNVSLESEEVMESELIVVCQTLLETDTYMMHFYKGKYIG